MIRRRHFDEAMAERAQRRYRAHDRGRVLIVLQERARRRLDEARRTGAPWVLLFDDVTPLGAQSLEMHVRTGRALHVSTDLPLDGTRPTWEFQVVQLDPADGAWLVDQPPLLPPQKFDTQDEFEARLRQARAAYGGD